MKKILCILDCKTKKYGYINFFEMLMDLRIYPSVRKNKYCNKNILKEKEVIMNNNELYHFGVKGMKWGVRKRYEGKGGSYTKKKCQKI